MRALPRGDRGQERELGLGFDVDAEDAFIDGERELARRLADAGEHDLFPPECRQPRARLSSPSETTSAPAPSLASVLITAWLEFAFMA